MSTPCVVILPAYKPGNEFVGLVRKVTALGFTCVVVNDGSGRAFDPVFRPLEAHGGCDVLHHAVNMGKGAALKTAFNWVLVKYPETKCVVTADADGQHSIEDIANLAAETLSDGSRLCLGVRDFEDASVPLRSAFGNRMTRRVIRILAGIKLSDTQTGLRGIPIGHLRRLLHVKPNRYEYELEMLLALHREGVQFKEIPIRTIYVDNNSSSHFNPLLDSAKIYFVLLRFSGSSLASALIDNIVFAVAFGLTGSMLSSTYVGRLFSGTFNFLVNRQFVFRSRKNVWVSFVQYVTLCVALAFISYELVASLARYLGVNVYVAKLLAETALFLGSFGIQRDFVFRGKKRTPASVRSPMIENERRVDSQIVAESAKPSSLRS